MMRWYPVNFQCQGVLLFWIIVEQGPIALAVGAGNKKVYHFAVSVEMRMALSTKSVNVNLFKMYEFSFERRFMYFLKKPMHAFTARCSVSYLNIQRSIN